MGEIAARSHVSGKKHQAAVTLSQTGSVSHFFGAKCETTPGLSSTGKPEEPSTSSSYNPGHTHKESEIVPTTQGNVLTKFLPTKHQHKAEILWALKTVMLRCGHEFSNIKANC